MKKTTFAAALMAITLSGCSDLSEVIEVGSATSHTGLGYGMNPKYVTIRSLVEEVEIQEVTVNRGECRVIKYNGRSQLPKTIRFGKTAKIQVNNDSTFLRLKSKPIKGLAPTASAVNHPQYSGSTESRCLPFTPPPNDPFLQFSPKSRIPPRQTPTQRLGRPTAPAWGRHPRWPTCKCTNGPTRWCP